MLRPRLFNIAPLSSCRHSNALKYLIARRGRSLHNTGPPPPKAGFARTRRWTLPVAMIATVGIVYTAYKETTKPENWEEVPITGRRRRKVARRKEIQAKLVQSAREELLSYMEPTSRTKILPPNHPLSKLGSDIVSRILSASDLGRLGPRHTIKDSEDENDSLLEDREWRMYVLDGPLPNACVLSGTRIITITASMFNLLRNTDMIASCLAHEIAHEIAEHALEKNSLLQINLSRSFLTWFYRDIFQWHEYEADSLGLLFMSRACYNPTAAISTIKRLHDMDLSLKELIETREHQSGRLFKNMKKEDTHPPWEDRIKALEKLLPAAFHTLEMTPGCSHTSQYWEMWKRAIGDNSNVPSQSA
ncbi:uncharacterized protein EV420DRAFT_1540495 [Desarmillaria tabescens]|uniref:Peptidase M48 domain-containing protein n=1 Tax=Armillaria tabescens TaxID=1929756 RepID=A0AA39N5L7_ARMTA|nr:uncharacterized protein EV420DRAFT_1540495 [Desarmillaria tabescens]KAK0458777.1 hypothetical protein EV420DRAFT_1540495 [Desarmillaria tabescens]